MDSKGKQGINGGTWPSISADGRYVAFESYDPLISGDTNGDSDVYVRDRKMGKTDRVSVNSTGGQTNNDSGNPSISSDGQYVAFYSKATNLIPNGQMQDESAPVGLNLFFVVLLIRKDFS